MGTFDISRVNFDPKKHFTSVRMQQGRVLTDDDWNEDNRIHEEGYRKTMVDIVGPFGSPDSGFKIENLTTTGGFINFDILPGSLYLGGLRLEEDEQESYRLQKDWLQQPADINKLPPFDAAESFDLVYVEAWQQAVSAVEDSALFEVALGGPDTTTRLRTMRRVHVAANMGFCDCADAWQQLLSKWKDEKLGILSKEFERISDALLKVSFIDSGLPEDLCTPNAAGGYLGAENQAIRVQIVDKDKLSWGFDNASPLYRVLVSDNKVHMLTEPKDQYHWPMSNQVVEILAWSAVLPNGEKVAEQMGHYSKVDASYNPDTGDFTLSTPIGATFGIDWKSRSDKNDLDDQKPPEHFYLRVWNRGSDLTSDPKIKFVPGTPASLGHTGLQVTITGNDFVVPDYWVIAARPETPNLVVPWELELKQGIPPIGVRRFFAPLAVIKWNTVNRDQVTGQIMHDCRRKFSPLTEQECCCTYTVGDGVRSKGDFNSIQEAVDSLPGDGGKICVLPGQHVANVTIVNRRQIRISGCGDQTMIRPGPNHGIEPIFLIKNSQKIQIDQLTLVAMDGIAIEVSDARDSKISSEKILINENRILAGIHAIKIRTKEETAGDNRIEILYNQIGMIDKPIGKPAIFSIADGVLIERNRIVVILSPERNDPDDPRKPEDPNGDPFNPCFDPRITYRAGYGIKFQVYLLIKYLTLYAPSGKYKSGYNATGGIQIGGTSERVTIRQNEIIGGHGNGITLGDVNTGNEAGILGFNYKSFQFSYSPLYEICIEENKILQMGLSGISSFFGVSDKQHYVHVDDITIYRNTIKHCAFLIPSEIAKSLLNDKAYGGIVLNDSENCRIQENRIEENGQVFTEPICGIFLLLAEKTEISNNSIINNGFPDIENILFFSIATKPGKRGGIIVAMSFKIANIKNAGELVWPSFDGIPAVTVHDNIVNQPLGHALFLVAYGPVSVLSNQFTSTGTDKTNSFSQLAGSVYIFNMGVSKDLPGIIGIQNAANGNPKFSKLISPSRAFQFLPNGKIMFSDNQTTLDMRSDTQNIGTSSQLIFSLDDVAFDDNQSECAGFISSALISPVVDIVIFNTLLFGISIRSNNNRFLDGLTFTVFSLLSYGFMNTAIGNQATHCMLINGAKVVKNSNIVLYDNTCKEHEFAISNHFGIAGKG